MGWADRTTFPEPRLAGAVPDEPPSDPREQSAREEAEARFARNRALRQQAVRELLANDESALELVAAAVADVIGFGVDPADRDGYAGRVLLRKLHDRAEAWFVEAELAS